jgi:hypothetical protein
MILDNFIPETDVENERLKQEYREYIFSREAKKSSTIKLTEKEYENLMKQRQLENRGLELQRKVRNYTGGGYRE